MKQLLWIFTALCLSPFCTAMQKVSKKIKKYSFPKHWDFKAIVPDASWQETLNNNKNWQALEQNRIITIQVFQLEDLQRKLHKQTAVLKKYKNALEAMRKFAEVTEIVNGDILLLDPLINFHEATSNQLSNTLEKEKLIHYLLETKTFDAGNETDYDTDENLSALQKQLQKKFIFCTTEVNQIEVMMHAFLGCTNSCHERLLKPASDITTHLQAFADSFKTDSDPFTNIVTLLSDFDILADRIALNEDTAHYYQASKELLTLFFNSVVSEKFMAGIYARQSISKAIRTKHQEIQKTLTGTLQENERIAIQHLSNRIARIRKAATSKNHTKALLDEIEDKNRILTTFNKHIQRSSHISVLLKQVVQKTFQAHNTYRTCALKTINSNNPPIDSKSTQLLPNQKLFPSDGIEHDLYTAKTIARELTQWKHAIWLMIDPRNTCTFEGEDGQSSVVAYKVHFVSNSQQSIDLSALADDLFTVQAFEYCDADDTKQSAQFMIHPKSKLYSYNSKFYLYNPCQDVARAYLVEQMLTECTENNFTSVASDANPNPTINEIPRLK